MKYSKQVVVEAVQYFSDMGTYTIDVPRWFIKAITDKYIFSSEDKTFIFVGDSLVEVHDGDWIVREKGEIYAVQKEVFEGTYQPFNG